jgi:hypothetical protein
VIEPAPLERLLTFTEGEKGKQLKIRKVAREATVLARYNLDEEK